MFAVPGFLMGNSDFPGAAGFEVAAWILGIPGLVLSYCTGFAYIPQVRARNRPPSGTAGLRCCTVDLLNRDTVAP